MRTIVLMLVLSVYSVCIAAPTASKQKNTIVFSLQPVTEVGSDRLTVFGLGRAPNFKMIELPASTQKNTEVPYQGLVAGVTYSVDWGNLHAISNNGSVVYYELMFKGFNYGTWQINTVSGCGCLKRNVELLVAQDSLPDMILVERNSDSMLNITCLRSQPVCKLFTTAP